MHTGLIVTREAKYHCCSKQLLNHQPVRLGHRQRQLSLSLQIGSEQLQEEGQFVGMGDFRVGHLEGMGCSPEWHKLRNMRHCMPSGRYMEVVVKLARRIVGRVGLVLVELGGMGYIQE